MFRYACLVLMLAPLCCTAAEEHAAALQTPPTTHQEYIPHLLKLLEHTEQSLAACTDAARVTAELPRLRELAERARQLTACQRKLSEPTVQDYIAAHPHVAAFNKLWEAICGHIARLEQAQLITPELRAILQLAPREN